MEIVLSSSMTVKEILDRYPQSLKQFVKLGLLCVGCPTEAFHTLADVAREYRIDTDQLLQSLQLTIQAAEEHPGKK